MRANPARWAAGLPSQMEEAVIAKCDAVIDLIGALFDIPGRELRRPGRSTTGISRTRQIAMYVAHVALQLSMAEVGRGFGRDRTTVLYACHLVEDMRDDPEFDGVVATAERIVRAAFNLSDVAQ
jgi:chromosomal replication initiation ATPase DnaA